MGRANTFWNGMLASVMAATLLGAAEVGRRPFTVLGADSGLASGVTCVAQDAQGFLLLGTENGLYRYEGGHSRHWTGADGLPSAYITRLRVAPDGALWIATARGLVRFKDGRMEPATLGGAPLGAAAGFLLLDRQGRIWTGTRQGLYVQKAGLEFEARPWLGAGVVTQPVEGARTGTFYFPSSAGLQALLPDGSTRAWGPADGLPATGIALVVEDAQGRVWAGIGRALAMLEPGAAAFTNQSHLLSGPLSPNSEAFLDRDGSLWLPTQNGALHLQDGRRELMDAAGGLPFRWVRTLFRDREGTLWIVGPAVAKLQGEGRLWNYTLAAGGSGEVVWAVARDRQGHLLVGTDDGAARLGPDGLVRIPGTGGHRLKGLAMDREGTLWMVGTLGPALWLRAGQTTAVEAPVGDLGTRVNSVTVDRAGTVWVGHSAQGLARWDAGARRLVQEVGPKFVSAPTLGVFKVVEDAAGRLWAASTAGLLVRARDGRWQLFTARDGLGTGTLSGMALLPDGTAWIHYQEPQALTRVGVEDGRLTVLERRTLGGSPNPDEVFGLQADAKGQVWATTDRGLYRLEPPLHLAGKDGMISEDCAINALLVEGSRVWVGTAGGLVGYDSAGPEAPATVPQAHVLEVTSLARRLEPPFGAMAPVPYREATLDFRVAAPSYGNEHDLRFQVRLLGRDEVWRDTEARVIHYAALGGGAYRFEVRAALGTAPFGPAAGLSFEVRPPWWRTWWALTLEALAAVAAVLGLVRWRVAALARSKAALEALVDLRTGELRARNGELSEALGNVKQLSGLLPICANCKKIRDDGGYWNQLEAYITKHSEADFSHGICPDCADELYPGFTSRTRPTQEAP